MPMSWLVTMLMSSLLTMLMFSLLTMQMSWLQTQQMSWLQTSMWLTGRRPGPEKKGERSYREARKEAGGLTGEPVGVMEFEWGIRCRGWLFL